MFKFLRNFVEYLNALTWFVSLSSSFFFVSGFLRFFSELFICVALLEDRGFQKWSTMRENLGDFYKFTAKGAKVNLLFMCAIPLTLGYIGYKTVGQYDLIAKRRTEPVYLDYVPKN